MISHVSRAAYVLAALVAVLLARRSPPLRAPALALVVLAALDVVRPFLGPGRLDVALFAAWPTISAWLIAGPWAVAWVAYGAAVALLGTRLGPWPWPLAYSRIALVVLFVRPLAESSPRVRVGLLLAAGQLAGVVVRSWPRHDAAPTWAERGAQVAINVSILAAIVVVLVRATKSERLG